MSRIVTGAAGVLAVLAGVTGHAPAAMPFVLDQPGEVSVEADASLRIMPLGDSITFGSGSETTSSYRVDLYRRLVAAGLMVDFVGSVRTGPAGAGTDLDNEGHPSWRIGDIAERADEWMATYRPDVVLLHIGTNDTHTAERAVGAVGRLSALIDQIAVARPTAHIFVAKIVGARNSRDNGAQQRRIDTINAALPGVVAGKGPLVHLVDHTSVDESDHLDHLHPNDYGFAKMSYLWYRALEPILNKTSQAWPVGANPFAVTRKYLRQEYLDGSVDGRWWYLRPGTVTVAGKARRVMCWQTVRTVTEAYRVWVPGKAQRRDAEVAVPGHYESRVRTVRKWVTS